MTPDSYDRLTLVGVDADHVLASWTLSAATRIRALRTLASRAAGAKLVLAVQSDGAHAVVVEPPVNAGELRLAVPSGASHAARLGLLLTDGDFVPLLDTAPARTPPRQRGATPGVPRWVMTADPTVEAVAPAITGTWPVPLEDMVPGSVPHRS